MPIHDIYTEEIKGILAEQGNTLPVLSNTNWKMLERSDFILDSETYLELGTIQNKSLSFSVCSSEIEFEDKIFLIGNDIDNLSGKVEDYAKIVLVDIKEDGDTNTNFKRVKEIERVKHSVVLSETMLRSSSLNGRECLRISEKAYNDGLNFSIIGSELINKLKSYDYVKNVAVYFIVDKPELIQKLRGYHRKLNMLTEALNNMFADIVLDCESCDIKEVCDEVEGMRESHKKMHKN